MSLLAAASVVIGTLISGATAEPPADAPAPSAELEPQTLQVGDPADQRIWEFSATASYYSVRDDKDYPALTLIADRDWLHLEARYNYEDLHTGSLFIGYNFSVGETVTFEATPMIGGIFGETDGIAPGYEITLGYKWLELYTEGEFVFDLNNSDDDYFYSWSELTVSPFDWLYAGIAAQRTKIRDDESDVQLGPMIGFAYDRFELTFYLFEPGGDDQTFATAFTVNF